MPAKEAHISVRITPTMKRRLRAAWEEEGITEADFVNNAIAQYLSRKREEKKAIKDYNYNCDHPHPDLDGDYRNS